MLAEKKVNVSFFCQRCLQPLKLDTSFSSINEHAIAELSLPVNSSPEVDVESTVIDHLIPAFHLDDSGNGTNGFTILGRERDTGGTSHTMKVNATLFDLISSTSEIDHPLCEECTDSLIELMDQQLNLMEKEWEDYKEFLEKLKKESREDDIDALRKVLEDLHSEEERLKEELKSVEEEEEAVMNELKEQETLKQKLESEEDRYWKEYSKHRHEFNIIEDEVKSLECQLSYTRGELDKFKKTNVFNASFHIWYSGHFGTINNFKLGRLPSAPVDWSEINAAWGQTALLLTVLANKMNLVFKNYHIVPYGNHSYIEVLSEQKVLPLYGSGGFRFLWDTKFDAAMVAFSECLNQFIEEVGKEDPTFCLPYRIEGGKMIDINDRYNEGGKALQAFSVKIQFNSEEQWTKALKFILTNLKWGLAWVSSRFAREE